ncbi:MAG: TadE/TadG family type IV pilus assembly protein [Candidatus Nanopelagicales bacterium]|nr:TadE/TadG family type IV pilus assembly protein [Candidatus Nanopelagicales bacterium]
MVIQLRRRLRRSPRGQGMVEFALLLPLLALLLVMALDAGRVFFGWVALQNASRIGADYAAAHADAWKGPPDPTQQNQIDRYRLLVRNDMQALGCKDTAQFNPVPDPNFDIDGDGTSVFEDGALVRVELYCDFGLLTPLAEDFMGSPATLHAKTDFAINRTINTGLPPPVDPPPPVGCEADERPVPDMVGSSMQDAYNMWVGRGFEELNFNPPVSNPNKNREVIFQWPTTPGGHVADDCADLDDSVQVDY